MFEMTYNEAMEIQKAQMAYYRQRIGRVGIKAIKSATKPCPGNPNEKMSVIEINRLVPRGGNFEKYIKHRNFEINETGYHLHNAMRNGKIYS